MARFSGVEELVRLRSTMPLTSSPAAFANAALQMLGVRYQHEASDLDAVPRSGRVIFIANHPFGALDGLIAIALLGTLRPDLRVFANEDLWALRELTPMLLPVEVHGRRAKGNAPAMRRALRWLEGEGALMMFPAGEVSHFDARARCVTDPPWSRAVALLARRARAAVVPLHFTGENRLLFQIAGFLHPWLRALMLPGELKRRAGSVVPVRVGAPLPYERLRTFGSDEALAAHLRVTTYLLAPRPVVDAQVIPGEARRVHPLALSGAPADCTREVARLPPGHLLINAGETAVYCAGAGEIPHLLDEVGRLRELTFRAAGEGTGRARDLDSFDDHYEHLVLWNRRREEVVGACRVGRVDEIRKRAGKRGLYTAGLFHYRDPFFQLLGPALELGRPFVRPEVQRNFGPVLTLWKGIGEYLARHPRYFRLLGPVSISNDYRELSRQLLVEFLRSHCFDPLLARFVRPANPVPREPLVRTLAAEVSMLGHLDALAALVEDIEPDRKGVPELMRQYLKLGGRMLAFNVDPASNHSIDCLLMVDLRQTDLRVLRKYLPESAVARIAAQGLRFPGIRKAG
jgi:putative hemolysin